MQEGECSIFYKGSVLRLVPATSEPTVFMLQIYYLPDERMVEPDDAITILDASLAAGIPHTHVCGGSARCSTCRVMVLEGQDYCAPRTVEEQKLAEQLGFAPNIRLACQTQIIRDGRITLRRLSLDTDDVALFHDQALGGIAPRFMGQEKQLAILFADIRGFTAFSESLLPYDVIYVLNRYFRRMGRVIQQHGGTINAYMGDGLMALFGVEQGDRPVERAVRAALDMLTALEELNPSLEALYHHRLRIGIGIHYGWAVFGSVGDPHSPKVTAIGDAVNLASRIESANKTLGTTFLISEEAYQEVKAQVQVQDCHHVALPGKSGEYALYELNGIVPPEPDYQLLSVADAGGARSPRTNWLQAIWRGFCNWLQRLFGKF